MSAFPTNPALEAAIIAHADEDTPRLVYADWLDENGDPDRAAFIRVQCRLAEMSPAEAEWVDLVEQQDELVARLKHRITSNSYPPPFSFGPDILGTQEEPYRRGFPYSINGHNADPWTEEELGRVVAELTRLVATTTLRGFNPSCLTLAELTGLLAAPVTAELSGLTLFPLPVTTEHDTERIDFYRLVARSPALGRVRHLILRGGLPPEALAELTKSEGLGAVRRLALSQTDGTPAELESFTNTPLFQRLHGLTLTFRRAESEAAFTAALGHLPDLRTLELAPLRPSTVPLLAAGPFPKLARLNYSGPLDFDSATALARARFPALTVLKAFGEARNDSIAELLKAEWFGRFRVLDLADNAIGDKMVTARAHPVAKTLRVLKLGENAFGNSGLTALATAGAFPELTTLSLRSHHKRKATPAALATFLSALRLPNLRHLDLTGWPLGYEGAKALAANRAFATLTRLDLGNCGIGDPGPQALFASRHLQNLVELRLSGNALSNGADALADPTVMPRLGECWLTFNKGREHAAKKLQRDGLHLVT